MQDSALYLEADEDITSAIDKLSKAPGPSVSIVVPKRSTMLQSIINLKLLKKAAETHKKELVLVTGDKIATDLAARVGLAVAPTLGAKAVVAEAEKPADLQKDEEVIDDSDPEPPPPPPETIPPPPPKNAKRPPILKRRRLGEAAAGAAVAGAAGSAAGTAEAAEAAGPPALTDAAGPKNGPKLPKVPKVPNFGRMQRRVMWVGAAAALVIGYFAFMYVFSSAKVVLFANGTRSDIDTTFAVDTGGSGNPADAVLAGQTVSFSKDLSGSFTPTGQQDAGTKAGGNITVSNCYDSNSHTFVAGTRFTAPDGKVFRSTADMTVPGGQGSFFGCTTPGTASVQVQADQNGDSYNEAAASYGIPGLPASEQQGQNSITAKGGQMSGGTSKIVTIVSQSDVDTAKTDLLAKDTTGASRDLQGKLPNGYMAISASQSTSTSDVNPAPAVGAQGNSGTLTLKVNYTVLAVKTSDYKAFVGAQEQKQVGAKNQIYDDGIGSSQLTSNGTDSSNRQSFHFTTEAFSGQKIDTAAVAKQLAGQRYGDASSTASGLPGVAQAQITNWPAWASNLPSRPAKIKVVIQVAKQ